MIFFFIKEFKANRSQLKYHFKSKLKDHYGLLLDWDLCPTTLLQKPLHICPHKAPSQYNSLHIIVTVK